MVNVYDLTTDMKKKNKNSASARNNENNLSQIYNVIINDEKQIDESSILISLLSLLWYFAIILNLRKTDKSSNPKINISTSFCFRFVQCHVL